MLNKITFNKVVSSWVFFCVALFFLLLFSIPRGYNIGASLLALTSLVIVPLSLYKGQKFSLQKVDKNVVIIFAIYGIGLTLINLWHNNQLKEFESSFKFLLAIPMLLLLYKYPIKPLWLFLLVMVATIIGAGLGCYNHNHYGWASRATVGVMNTIHFSSIIQIFAVISLIGIVIVQEIHNKILKIIYIMFAIIAFTMGMYASGLSMSRGVWLAIPFQLFFVGFFYYRFYKKTVAIILLLLSMCFVVLYLAPQTGIKKRIDQTFLDISSYQEGKTGTSGGLRLEMYKFSLLITKENPILGTPMDERKGKLQQLTNEKVINPSIKRYKFLHSRYFETLARYGITGIILLFLLDLIILNMFWKRMRSSNIVVQALGASGILVIISYIVYGLTDNLFLLNVGLLAYIVMIISFCSSIQESCKVINDK